MIDQETAATEIRRLSRLKNYPRSWESAGEAAAEQDAQAETALIAAAATAPDLGKLKRFVADWERRHVDAPVPAVLYEAWRNGTQYAGVRRRQKCGACGDAGWVTRYYVMDAIAGGKNQERIYIGESEVDDWWERIRENKTCAQRVYEDAVRCGCGSVAPEVQPDDRADESAFADFRNRAAGDQ